MSTISVLIPAYNAESTIRAAIDSALAQTLPVHEVLVVDDGSSDKTPDVVEAYGEKVRLVRQTNAGPAQARNHGVELATGEWIAFLDADDTWRSDKLEKQVAAMRARPEAVLCYTGLRMLLPDGSETIEAAFPDDQVSKVLRIYNPNITPSAVLLRRQVLLASGGFDASQKGCEDWDLWFRLSRMGSFCGVPEPLTIYTVSNTGLSSNAARVFDDFLQLLDRVLLLDLEGLPRVLWRRRIIAFQAYKAALTARGSGDYQNEWKYFLQSLTVWPSPFWYPKRWKAMAVTALRRRSVRVTGK